MTPVLAPTELDQPLDLAELIRQRRENFCLPRPFYTDPRIFALDIERVFRPRWLFAGHISRIPNPGDYYVFNLAGDSVIIIRHDATTINAFHNVCRHRGSAICTSAAGHVKKLVCPYHQWVFDTDGRLLSARSMPDDFDLSAWGLKPVATYILEGFIFICLADNPPDFERVARDVLPFLQPHDFPAARICYTAEYDVKANWKLIIENSRECDHCPVGHPEYTRLMLREGGTETPDELSRHLEDRVAHYHQCGLATKRVGCDWYFASRYPFARKGAVSESLDGSPVAPLMGSFKDRDAGVMATIIQPTFMFEASADHAVSMQFIPIHAALTRVRMDWYVRRDAVEGRDYDVNRIIAFWKATGEQDWKLCEDNQAGINSSAYEPGPYSTCEDGVEAFVRWYLRQVGQGDRPSPRRARRIGHNGDE